MQCLKTCEKQCRGANGAHLYKEQQKQHSTQQKQSLSKLLKTTRVGQSGNMMLDK